MAKSFFWITVKLAEFNVWAQMNNDIGRVRWYGRWYGLTRNSW